MVGLTFSFPFKSFLWQGSTKNETSPNLLLLLLVVLVGVAVEPRDAASRRDDCEKAKGRDAARPRFSAKTRLERPTLRPRPVPNQFSFQAMARFHFFITSFLGLI